jgi:hypothetical protein
MTTTKPNAGLNNTPATSASPRPDAVKTDSAPTATVRAGFTAVIGNNDIADAFRAVLPQPKYKSFLD